MKNTCVVLGLVVLAAGGTLLIGSCGGGGGSDSGTPSVALLADTDYVDNDVTDNRAEASNVYKTLQHLSVDAVAFTGVAPAAFTAALEGRSALAIPELDSLAPGNLASDLNSTAAAAILDFVQSGGSFLIFSGEIRNLAVANTIFGTSMEFQREVYDTISLDPAVAAGTHFAGAPSTLGYPNQVTAIDSATLPPPARRMYADSGMNSVVLVVPYGSGHIICLGWDWDWGDWTLPDTPITEGDEGAGSRFSPGL